MQKSATIVSVTIAFLILSTLMSFAQGTNNKGKLRIEVNTNAELLGVAYFIGFEGVDIEDETILLQGKEILKKDWHNYGYYIYQKYKSFGSSENLAASFSVADHLWLDYILNLLLQVHDFPNAKLLPEIDEKYYVNFSTSKDTVEAKKNVESFLEGLNKFYIEVN